MSSNDGDIFIKTFASRVITMEKYNRKIVLNKFLGQILYQNKLQDIRNILTTTLLRFEAHKSDGNTK